MSAIAVLPIDSHLVYESERGRKAYPMSPVRYGRAMGAIVPYRAWLAFHGAGSVAPMAPYIHIQGELRRMTTIPGDAPFVAVNGLVVDKLDYAPEDAPLVDVFYEFESDQIDDLVQKGLYTREFQSDEHIPDILTKAVYECPVDCRFRVMWSGPAMWQDVLDRARKDGNNVVAAEAERELAASMDRTEESVPVIFCDVERPGSIVMTRANSGYSLNEYFERVISKGVEADFEAAFADGPFAHPVIEEAHSLEEAPALVVGEPEVEADDDLDRMAEAAAAALREARAEDEARRRERIAEGDTSLPEGFEDVASSAPSVDPEVEELHKALSDQPTQAFDIRQMFEAAAMDSDTESADERVAAARIDERDRRERDKRTNLLEALFGGEEAALTDEATDARSEEEAKADAYEENMVETMRRQEGNENTNAYLVMDGSMSLDEAGNKVDSAYVGADGLADLAADYGSSPLAAILDGAAKEVAAKRIAFEGVREVDREVVDAPASPDDPTEVSRDSSDFDDLFGGDVLDV